MYQLSKQLQPFPLTGEGNTGEHAQGYGTLGQQGCLP